MPTRKQAKNLAYDPEVPPQYESEYGRAQDPDIAYQASPFDAGTAGPSAGGVSIGGRQYSPQTTQFSFSPFQQPKAKPQQQEAKGSEGSGGLRTISSGPSYGRGATGTQTITTYTPPTGPKPEFTSPDYKPVEFDKRRLAALRQRHAAPFRREAMRALQTAFTRSYGSKPERDMAIRNALNQYGTAYGKIMSQAEQTAGAEYAMEREELQRERVLEFNAAISKAQADFKAAWDAWSRTGTQTTISAPTGGGADGGGYFRPYMRVGRGIAGGSTDIDIGTGMAMTPENMRVIRMAGR